MENKTTIHLTWDESGKISNSLSGITSLLPPRQDVLNWILAPSAIMLLAHQFGVLKPTRMLRICSEITDRVFSKIEVRVLPIGAELNGVNLDIIYTGGPSLKFLVHPKHRFFANSDALEEAMSRVIKNFTAGVFDRLDERMRLVFSRSVSVSIGIYYGQLEREVDAGMIGRLRDAPSLSIATMGAKLKGLISANWNPPGSLSGSEYKKWEREEMEFLEEQSSFVSEKQKRIFKAMGLT